MSQRVLWRSRTRAQQNAEEKHRRPRPSIPEGKVNGCLPRLAARREAGRRGFAGVGGSLRAGSIKTAKPGLAEAYRPEGAASRGASDPTPAVDASRLLKKNRRARCEQLKKIQSKKSSIV